MSTYYQIDVTDTVGRKDEMSTYYQIDVTDAQGGKFAQAFGDLDTINYIARKVVKDIEGHPDNLALNLVEVDAIGGQPVREVVALVANAKVVATVLKGELTSERKAARTSATEQLAATEDEAFPSNEPEIYVDADDRAI